MSKIVWHETKMTANNAPSPLVASANTEFSATVQAWSAFSGKEDIYGWSSTSARPDNWIKIQFGAEIEVDRVRIRSSGNPASTDPKSIEIKAKENGKDVVLYTGTQSAWSYRETREFVFNRKYKITEATFNVVATGSTVYVSIGQILFGVEAPDNKSLILHEGEYKKWNPQQDATVDIYSENIIPIMATNTSPSGLAFLDTQTSDSYRASYAFDRQSTTLAESNSRDGFIGYKFTTPKKINAYSIQIGSLVYSISNWKFQGSEDTTNGTDGVWEDLQNVSYVFTALENKTFYFNNNKDYIAYRIKWTKASTESQYSDFYEIGFYEKISDGKPEIKPYWSIGSSVPPSSAQFLEQGMDSLSPLLDRKIIALEPMPMADKSEISQRENGKVFELALDLRKYFDIRNVKAVDNLGTTGGLTFKANDRYKVVTLNEYRKVINMTSNTTPAPFVTSASGSNSSFPPWKAFDGVTTGSIIGWAVSARNGWLQIDFGKTTGVSGFTLHSGKNGGYYFHDYSPSVFSLAGSHDGQKWEIIQDYTASWGGNNANNLSKEFTCKPAMYRYYRLNVDKVGNGSQIYVGEMFFKVFDASFVEYPLDSKYLSISKLNSIICDIRFEDKKYVVKEDGDTLTSTKLNRKPLSIKFD